MALSNFDIHNKLTNDFNYFNKNAPLIIQDKEGQIVPFQLNKAQHYFTQQINAQAKQYGWVRALVLKGRQQGISTKVSARFFHKTIRNPGTNTFIMAHDGPTSGKLFRKAKFFYERIEKPLRPHIEYSNSKELFFDKILSSFFVGTAGSGAVGRGGTNQLLHGSEVAFWPNPDEIKTGLMQTVPESRGTEIILESTANGYDPMFYPMVQEARKGRGTYKVIFIPWFWQDEYRADATGLIPTSEEQELIKAYGLDLEQIAFRRNKISFFNNSEKKFMQEYPNNVDEAFQTSGSGLWTGTEIANAQARSFHDFDSPIVMGCDIATTKDRLCYVIRQGRRILYMKSHSCEDEGEKSTSEICGEILQLGKEFNVSHCFIDLGEAGKGVVDNLNDILVPFKVTGVRFNWEAKKKDQYFNLRSEMYGDAHEWTKDASLPDNEELVADLRVIPEFINDLHDRFKLPRKEKIKEEFGFSPDLSDAFVLTFAYPVKNTKIRGANSGQVKVKKRTFKPR